MTKTPKFAANLTMLFTEFPFLERIDAAAEAGFSAVEFLFPYAFDKAEVAARVRKNGLVQALINAPAGDWEGGERGLAILPGREQEFRDGVETALDYARALDCKKIHVMSGIMPERANRDDMKALWLANIRQAADRVAPFGISIQIESLNHRNMPGYFIANQYDALALVQETGRDNVFVQLDIFHAQITNGDLSVLIHNLGSRIGHVQIASVPDRGEPDSGEVYFPHIYKALAAAGYNDWIGCEYIPRAGTLRGLSWLKKYPQPVTSR